MGVWGSSLLFCLCRLWQGNKCSIVRRHGSASAGVMIWLLAVTLPFIPFGPQRPWPGPDGQSQLHNQPRSPTVIMCWCTSVGLCLQARRYQQTPSSELFKWNGSLAILTKAQKHHVVSFNRKWEQCQIGQPAFKCVEGINKSLWQITAAKFPSERIYAKQKHALELGSVLHGRMQLLFACK